MRSLLLVLLHALILFIALLTNAKAVNALQTATREDKSSLTSSSIRSEAATRLEATDLDERGNVSPLLGSVFTDWASSVKTGIKSSIQAQKWLWTKQQADDIIMRHKLDDKMDNILANPKFHAFVTFMGKLKKKHPDKAVSTIEVLSKHYGESAVARELEVALTARSQKVMAVKLINEQLANWKLFQKHKYPL